MVIDKLVEIIKEDLIAVLKTEKEIDGYLNMADYATMVDRSDAVMLDSTIRARAIGALAGCYYHRNQKGEDFDVEIKKLEDDLSESEVELAVSLANYWMG